MVAGSSKVVNTKLNYISDITSINFFMTLSAVQPLRKQSNGMFFVCNGML